MSKQWVSTKIVFDMVSGVVREREGFWYDGPVEELKPGKTGQQKQAENVANQDFGTQTADMGAAQGTLSQFEGPVQNSPFYKSLLTTGIQNTSNAYQNAASNQKAQANAAGFGQNQPVAQGANNQLQAQETSALAQVPQTAMTEAAPLSLAAAGQSGQMGESAGSQGLNALNLASQLQLKRQGGNPTVGNVFGGGSGGSGGGGGISQDAMMAALMMA